MKDNKKQKEIVRIENLEKHFDDKTVLNKINLSIYEGESIALIGSSGTGKTTLFNTITNTVFPDSGNVYVFDKKVSEYNNKEFAKKIGILTQKFDLIEELSVINNVLAGRLAYWGFFKSMISLFHPMDKDIAENALERVSLLDKIYEKTSNLSGGEQQRVALARLLVQQPRIILADEPIASLDPALSDAVLSMLTKLTREDGITLVSSMHSIDFALKYFDRIIGLKNGDVIIDCKPEEVDEQALKRLYE